MRKFNIIFTILLLLAVLSFAQDSLNVERIASIYDYDNGCRDFTIEDNRAYIVQHRNGLKIVDISDPSQPLEIGEYLTQDIAYYSIEVIDDFAFIATDSGLLILFVNDPDNIQEVGSFRTGASLDLQIQGDLLYLIGMTYGLVILDISDLGNPDVINRFMLAEEIAFKLNVIRNYAFMHILFNETKILDIAEPDDISEIGNLPESTGAFLQGDILFLSERDDGLKIYNMAEPENIELQHTIDSQDSSVDFILNENVGYLADGEAGIRIFDISDFDQIVEVGFYNTPEFVKKIRLGDDGLLYVSERNSFNIYRYTPENSINHGRSNKPLKFTLYPLSPTPFNSSTKISFNLPERSLVNMSVWDMNGRRVTTLFEDCLTRGSHSFNWSGENLVAGAYILRLDTPNESRSVKAVYCP